MNQQLDSPSSSPDDAVLSLLLRHGIDQSRKQVALLEAVLGLTSVVARRRLAGTSPYTIEELERLAVHFNEPVFELAATLLSSVGQSRRATIKIGSGQARCVIWTGRLLAAGERSEPLVAIDADGLWTVVPVAEATGLPAYEITRLVYETALLPKIAVLDDDPDISEPTAEFLRAKGLAAMTYAKADQVLVALESTTFAGFVLDWHLHEGDVLGLLGAIRLKAPTAPILILTGRISDGTVREDEVAQATTKYQCLLFEKPARPLVLYNALQVAAARPRT